jgi:metal-dependent HD superfamily phosphatase/phosphodiesterase
MIQIVKGIYCICIHHHSADYYLLDTMLIFVYVYIMIELHKLNLSIHRTSERLLSSLISQPLISTILKRNLQYGQTICMLR